MDRECNYVDDIRDSLEKLQHELHKRDEYISKLLAAINKAYLLNEETARDYRRVAPSLPEFEYKISGLLEANANLRVCLCEVDERIF